MLGFIHLTENVLSNLMNHAVGIILETLIGPDLASTWPVLSIFISILTIIGVAFAMSGLYSVFIFINSAVTYANATRLWMLQLA